MIYILYLIKLLFYISAGVLQLVFHFIAVYVPRTDIE